MERLHLSKAKSKLDFDSHMNSQNIKVYTNCKYNIQETKTTKSLSGFQSIFGSL